MPPALLQEVDTDILLCAPAIAYAQLAHTHDVIDLALVAYELTGTYAIRSWEDGKSVSISSPICTIEELRAYCTSCRSLKVRGSGLALKALDLVEPMSNSAAESNLALMLMAKGHQGGFNLRGFRLNETVMLPADVAKLHGYDRLTPDVHFIGTKKSLEYESDEYHLTSKAKEQDAKRGVSFSLAGYTVYQLSRLQVNDRDYLWDFAKMLRRELGRRGQVPREQRYLELHDRLFCQRCDPLERSR